MGRTEGRREGGGGWGRTQVNREIWKGRRAGRRERRRVNHAPQQNKITTCYVTLYPNEKQDSRTM